MERSPHEPGERAATPADMARYSVELDAIRDAMADLATSRLADTSAWVQTSWIVAQAEGMLTRVASGWWTNAPSIAELEGAVQSAWAALRALESLGQAPSAWEARNSERRPHAPKSDVHRSTHRDR